MRNNFASLSSASVYLSIGLCCVETIWTKVGSFPLTHSSHTDTAVVCNTYIGAGNSQNVF